MRIREFLTLGEIAESEGNLDQEVTGLAYDSRKVGAGEIFFAVPGIETDGHDYIAAAIKSGAVGVVYSRQGHWPGACVSVRVKDVRRTMGLWAAHFYNRPSQNLKLVGVTGTNGKTTLTYLVESMLKAAALEPGVIGTINCRYRGDASPSHHTTPESLDLHRLLAEMAQAGVQSVAMEVSSHALVQERVRGLEFDVGVFTNLSRDHLDYHRDMDDYFVAKSRLFTDYLDLSPKPRKAAVIYGEDPRGNELSGMAQAHGLDVWSYGEGGAWEVHPLTVEKDISGCRGRIHARERTIEFDSPLIGSANLQNILGAVGVGCALGLDSAVISQGIHQLRAVPGRVEKVENPLGITILVDYAHTPDALAKVLTAVRPLARGRLITVFGCGGDRDRGKRPLMGEIAGHLSDWVMVTSDNPRSENPRDILTEIEAGIGKIGLPKIDHASSAFAVGDHQAGRGYCVEVDRRSAIRIAVSWARPGDLVMIAGKGHEDYQILGTQKIHFDDREVAREESFTRANE